MRVLPYAICVLSLRACSQACVLMCVLTRALSCGNFHVFIRMCSHVFAHITKAISEGGQLKF